MITDIDESDTTVLKTYSVDYWCRNCGHDFVAKAAVGVPSPDTLDCPECGCYETAEKQVRQSDPDPMPLYPLPNLPIHPTYPATPYPTYPTYPTYPWPTWTEPIITCAACGSENYA